MSIFFFFSQTASDHLLVFHREVHLALHLVPHLAQYQGHQACAGHTAMVVVTVGEGGEVVMIGVVWCRNVVNHRVLITMTTMCLHLLHLSQIGITKKDLICL